MPNTHEVAPRVPSWGTFLTQRLEDLHMPASELCRRSGLHPSVVSRWLAGHTVPSIPHLRSIASALDESMLELLVAAGHLTNDEVTATRTPSVAAAISADPRLRPEFRKLLTYTYRSLTAIDAP